LKVVKNPLPLVGFLEQHIAEAVIIEIWGLVSNYPKDLFCQHLEPIRVRLGLQDDQKSRYVVDDPQRSLTPNLWESEGSWRWFEYLREPRPHVKNFHALLVVKVRHPFVQNLTLFLLCLQSGIRLQINLLLEDVWVTILEIPTGPLLEFEFPVRGWRLRLRLGTPCREQGH
jgi:hypothetical protein